MESSYGVGTQNRFGLFFDDECDPFDIVATKNSPKSMNVEEKENKSHDKPSSKSKGSSKVLKGETGGANVAAAKSGSQRNDSRTKLSDQEERNNRRNRNEGTGPKRGMAKADQTNEKVQRSENRRPDGGERPQRRFDRPQRRFEGGEQGVQQQQNGGENRRFEGQQRRFGGNNEGFEGGRGRGGGRGFPGGRGGRGGFRGGRREFDRHSGSERTGVRATDKREGGGSYNWGNPMEDMDKPENDVQEEKEKVEIAEEVENTSGQEESGAENKEPEEPKEMTLSEYKAQMRSKHVKPEFKIRKAGEGEDSTQWKSTYVLKKKEVQDEKESESSSEDEATEVHQQPKTKTFLEIDFQFSDSPMRGGRGRGRGRGAGMGRGGMGPRGRGRGGAYNRTREQKAPKMDDECDFPSLK